MNSLGIIIILIIKISYTKCDKSSLTIRIPLIPLQHVECWLRNQHDVDRIKLIDYCQNNHNLIIIDYAKGILLFI